MKNLRVTSAQYHLAVARILSCAAGEANIPQATALELASANKTLATLHFAVSGESAPLTHTAQMAVHHADAILDGDVSSASILRTLHAQAAQLCETLRAETGWDVEAVFASVNAAGHVSPAFETGVAAPAKK